MAIRASKTIARPNTPDGLARAYEDNWAFRLRPGLEAIDFPDLYYARWALESYAVFRELRDRGVIPPRLRFQVSLPTPLGGFGTFFPAPHDRELVGPAYESAMLREVAEICARIPHDDLAIQWDVCVELLEVVTGVAALPGDPLARAAAQFERISRVIPSGVSLGFHFCYGDLAHRHLVEPDTLALSVRMANLAIANSGRRTDWVHVPVPIARNDDAYFAPLRDLRPADAKVFLGLVHLQMASRARLRGRAPLAVIWLASVSDRMRTRPASTRTLAEVLGIHREVARRLAETSA